MVSLCPKVSKFEEFAANASNHNFGMIAPNLERQINRFLSLI